MERPYKLYIGAVQEIPASVLYSYYNADEEYILIYTQEKVGNSFVLVDDTMLSEMSRQEKAWFLACKAKINAEKMRDNIDEYTDILSQFCDFLEAELKKESEKTDETGGT